MQRNCRRVSRGSVFLLAMVALVALLFLGTSLVEVAIHGLSFSSNQQKRAQALALAESGVEMVLEKLYDDYDNAATTLDTTGTYAGDFTLGDGTVEYVATAPFAGLARSCEIRSTGVTRTNKRETIRVVAVYHDDVDRVFQGAIFCNDNLTLKGGGSVLPDDTGAGAEIYARGYIDFSTPAAFAIDPPDPDTGHVGGNGTIYSASPTISEYPDEMKPENVHLGIAPLPMPTIDLDYYRDQAQNHGGKYYDKSQNITGHTNFTALCPGPSNVVFVEGDVTISGNYSGTATIVASGTIKVGGGGILSNSGSDALALISPKGVRLTGGSEVDALIYSHGVTVQSGGVGVGGNITIRGAIVADVVQTNGDITVQYDPVWPGLDIPGSGRSQYQQISWEELPG
jgi:hypothetical protein